MNDTGAPDEVAGPHVSGRESRRQVKRDRFIRIAARRTQQVLDRLQLLAKCANRGVYEYEADDVAKIFGAIQEQLDETRRKFEDRTRQRVEFKL